MIEEVASWQALTIGVQSLEVKKQKMFGFGFFDDHFQGYIIKSEQMPYVKNMVWIPYECWLYQYIQIQSQL